MILCAPCENCGLCSERLNVRCVEASETLTCQNRPPNLRVFVSESMACSRRLAGRAACSRASTMRLFLLLFYFTTPASQQPPPPEPEPPEPSPPPPPPPYPPLPDDCAMDYSQIAAGNSCGSRVNWVMNNHGLTRPAAEAQVASEYPDVCNCRPYPAPPPPTHCAMLGFDPPLENTELSGTSNSGLGTASGSSNEQTAENCCTLCASTVGCGGFTQWGSTCWLKGGTLTTYSSGGRTAYILPPPSPPAPPSTPPLGVQGQVSACAPCACRSPPAGSALAQLPPEALQYYPPLFISVPMSLQEGCYDFNSVLTDNVVTGPPTWRAPCNATQNPDCNNGACQAQGYHFYHPAFDYQEGCYNWHGGSNPTLGTLPIRWGDGCICLYDPPSEPPPPSPPPRIVGAIIMGGIECPAGSDGARLNQLYVQAGQTLDGRPYYQSSGGTHADFLYYDAAYTACMGTAGDSPLTGWFVGGQPNTALRSGLVSYCRIDLFIEGNGLFPPEGAINLLWKYCGTDGAPQPQGAYATVQNPPPPLPPVPPAPPPPSQPPAPPPTPPPSPPPPSPPPSPPPPSPPPGPPPGPPPSPPPPSPPPAPPPSPPPCPPTPPSSPPAAPPFAPLAFSAEIGVSLDASATEGKTAAELAAALVSATGGGTDSEVVIQKRSTLGLSLPAGADPAAALDSVQSSVCAGRADGCSVTISSRRRELGAFRRQLQSTEVTFVVTIPVGAADSLSANATESASLTSALTSSLATAIGQPVTVATPIATSTAVTITIVVLGTADEAAAAGDQPWLLHCHSKPRKQPRR